jgi:two-component system, NarL family, nitrate/nitrite response regulator NarL
VALHRPAVVVIDRHLGEGDGIDLLPAVLAASPATRAMVLTADADAAAVRLARAAGAAGLMSKTGGVTALVNAITRVASGGLLADDPAADGAGAGGRPAHRPDDVARLAAFLTRRERECLALMVDGYGSGAMAEHLGVSVATVRGYVQGVLTKLGVHSRVEAASLAVRFSLHEPVAG